VQEPEGLEFAYELSLTGLSFQNLKPLFGSLKLISARQFLPRGAVLAQYGDKKPFFCPYNPVLPSGTGVAKR
jgi:hypothetical protein